MMRLPIGLALAAAMGSTLVAATGGTLGYLSQVASESAAELIADKGRLTLDRSHGQIDAEMQRIRDLAETLRALVLDVEAADGLPIGRERLAALGRAVLQSAPAAGLIYQDDGAALAVGRDGRVAALAVPPDLPAAPGWGAALRLSASGPLTLPYHRPLGDGRGVAVLLDLEQLSRRLAAGQDGDPAVSFLLDGGATVLAHSDVSAVQPGAPLGPGSADPVPDLIAHPGPDHRPIPGVAAGFLDRREGPMYAVFHRPVADAPRLLAGIYYQARDLGAEADAIVTALVISGGLLALVIAGAFLLGNRIGRPMRRLAAVAKRMETLAIKDAPRLPRSTLREIDDANQAVNAAIGGLGAFARYVPRELVLRLLRPDAIGAVRSSRREVTILFTDIAGYTAAAGRMSAEETAAFLNHHFELMAACVEAEAGTVDKFIGDSLMAFWGAPEPQPDHAERTVRAARAMVAAFRADATMAAAGVRLRIGLHTGEVVVGNVGASARTSYTVIGDAVNVAARLEQLGKEIDDAGPAVVLTTSETDALLPAALRGSGLGLRRLRGVAREIAVVRLA